jgi:hypothetical protein
LFAVVVNAMPRVIVEADNYAHFVEHSLVVVAEGKECESLFVPIVVLVDTGYM